MSPGDGINSLFYNRLLDSTVYVKIMVPNTVLGSTVHIKNSVLDSTAHAISTVLVDENIHCAGTQY